MMTTVLDRFKLRLEGNTGGKVVGFNLHAGIAIRADERRKLERLSRYIASPAVIVNFPQFNGYF